jgi:hypothetical protein
MYLMIVSKIKSPVFIDVPPYNERYDGESKTFHYGKRIALINLKLLWILLVSIAIWGGYDPGCARLVAILYREYGA